MCELTTILAVTSALTGGASIKNARDTKKERQAEGRRQTERAETEKTKADLKLRDERSENYGKRTRQATGRRSASTTVGFSSRSFFAAG